MMAPTLFQSGSVFLTKAVSHEVFRSKCRYFGGVAGGCCNSLCSRFFRKNTAVGVVVSNLEGVTVLHFLRSRASKLSKGWTFPIFGEITDSLETRIILKHW